MAGVVLLGVTAASAYLFVKKDEKTPQAYDEAAEFIRQETNNNKVVLFYKRFNPQCQQAKRALNRELGRGNFKVIQIRLRSDCALLQDVFQATTGVRDAPRVYILGRCIGGGPETSKLQRSGKLRELLQSNNLLRDSSDISEDGSAASSDVQEI